MKNVKNEIKTLSQEYSKYRNDWAMAFAMAKVSPQTKALGYILHAHMNSEKQYCWLKQDDIALRLNTSKRTFERYLKELEESGWITVDRTRGNWTYRLANGDSETTFWKGNCNNKRGNEENLKKHDKVVVKDSEGFDKVDVEVRQGCHTNTTRLSEKHDKAADITLDGTLDGVPYSNTLELKTHKMCCGAPISIECPPHCKSRKEIA